MPVLCGEASLVNLSQQAAADNEGDLQGFELGKDVDDLFNGHVTVGALIPIQKQLLDLDRFIFLEHRRSFGAPRAMFSFCALLAQDLMTGVPSSAAFTILSHAMQIATLYPLTGPTKSANAYS